MRGGKEERLRGREVERRRRGEVGRWGGGEDERKRGREVKKRRRGGED